MPYLTGGRVAYPDETEQDHANRNARISQLLKLQKQQGRLSDADLRELTDLMNLNAARAKNREAMEAQLPREVKFPGRRLLDKQEDRAAARASEVVYGEPQKSPQEKFLEARNWPTSSRGSGPYGMPDMSGTAMGGHSTGMGGFFTAVPHSQIHLGRKKAELEWMEMEVKMQEMIRRLEEARRGGVRDGDLLGPTRSSGMMY